MSQGFGAAYRALTSTAKNPAAWLVEFFGGQTSRAGIKVSANTVLGLAPVIYAVNKISGHLAQLPLNIYDHAGDHAERTLQEKSPAYRLLNVKPNDYMTPFTLREVVAVHSLVSGNGRAYIVRNEIGTPVGLIPINPADCQTMLVGGQKYHMVTINPGSPQDALPDRLRKGEFYKVPDRDMFHIMNTSYNGVWGMHLVEMARDVFGLAQGGQEGAAYALKNSGQPSLILEAPVGAFRNPKDADEFLRHFNEKHEGVSKRGAVGLLREGVKATTVPISAHDAQFLQQRGFQREEIALLFGLESIMGDNSGQTYRSISERNTAYVNNTLQRWFSKWTSEIKNKLINPARPLHVEFDSTPLLKGDPNNLADYTLKMSQQHALTVNEIRNLHGFDPIEGGDELPKPEPVAPPPGEEEQENPEENPEEDDEAGIQSE